MLRKLRLPLLAAFAIVTVLTAAREARAAEPYSIAVPVLSPPPRVDAIIDESWAKAAQVDVLFDFTYQRPGELTQAYIAQDSNALYVAFKVTQKETITAGQETNSAGVTSDDTVSIVLFPQGTQGFAYAFTSNALGSRYQTSSENSAYSPQWTAAAKRSPSGYVVTMRIPFNLIRSGGSHNWRVQFERRTVAANSTQVWEHVQGQRFSSEAGYAGTLTGVGGGLQTATRPQPRLQLYALDEIAARRIGGNTSRLGADLAIPVTATSSFVAALHPDYSNVEVDQQSIAPSAYARHFSEVRPFFTQVGQNFNNTFSCTNCPNTLYTPAVPTFHRGYAYEGTQGPFSFAAFDAVGEKRTDNAQTVNYFSDKPGGIYGISAQRVGVSGTFGNDITSTVDLGYQNRHSHYFYYLNAGNDRGTFVTDPGLANYLEYGGGFVDKTTTAGLTLQRVGPQFNPLDGFTQQSDIAGYFAFYNHTQKFSPTARVQQVFLSSYFGRYNDGNGQLAQTDAGGQLNINLRKLLTFHVFVNSQGVKIYNGEFLPFNANGFFLGYKSRTSTPSGISYSGGPFSHGHLTSWTYSTTLPIRRKIKLALETDENFYAPIRAPGEPVARQWLERASLDWQITKDASFDVGARRIFGRNLPNAFQAPDLPTAAAPCGVINGFRPFDCVKASNVSLAFHVLALKNEFYIVYGDPNSLSTKPALFLKWIRYIGAQKGT